MAVGNVQSNPGGSSDNYSVVNPNNFDDTGGDQQSCASVQDGFKAITSMAPTATNFPAIQAFHDVLCFLLKQYNTKTALGSGEKAYATLLLPGICPPESGWARTDSFMVYESEVYAVMKSANLQQNIMNAYTGSQAIFFQPFSTPLQTNLFRHYNTNGTLDVTVHVPATPIGSVQADNVEDVVDNLRDAIQSLKAFSPMAEDSGDLQATSRDLDADNVFDFNGTEYNKVLLYLLLQAYFPGLVTSTGEGTTTSYSVNPFGISFCPGASFVGADRTDGIRRYLGRETTDNGYDEDFDFDLWCARSLFSDGTDEEKLGYLTEVIQSLAGSDGKESFSEDTRVASGYFSMPIVVPVSITWS